MGKICPIIAKECIEADCHMWGEECGMCAIVSFTVALKRRSDKLAALRAEKQKREEEHGK